MSTFNLPVTIFHVNGNTVTEIVTSVAPGVQDIITYVSPETSQEGVDPEPSAHAVASVMHNNQKSAGNRYPRRNRTQTQFFAQSSVKLAAFIHDCKDPKSLSDAINIPDAND